jgi:thiamine transport system substrate-binding protein
MYDATKIKPYPSWKMLLADTEANKKLIVEDPRTSSIGFGLLLWLRKIYPTNFPEVVKQLQAKTLTISKGWAEAYGLFLKGEAPMVLSYTLSEAYHREKMKEKSPYRYMEFNEGHLVQIETVGISRTAKNLEMAKKFVDHLLTKESQQLVATKEWMYPVVSGVAISAVSKKVKRPDHIITASASEFPPDFRAQWTRQWIDVVTTK